MEWLETASHSLKYFEDGIIKLMQEIPLDMETVTVTHRAIRQELDHIKNLQGYCDEIANQIMPLTKEVR